MHGGKYRCLILPQVIFQALTFQENRFLFRLSILAIHN